MAQPYCLGCEAEWPTKTDPLTGTVYHRTDEIFIKQLVPCKRYEKKPRKQKLTDVQQQFNDFFGVS